MHLLTGLAVALHTVRADNQPNDSVRIAVIQASVGSAHGAQERKPIELERTTVTGIRRIVRIR